MNKNKFAIIAIINVLVFSFLSMNVFSMTKVDNTMIKEYISKLKNIENQYYLAGQSLIENKENKELEKEIKFYLTNVLEIKDSMNDYLNTIKDDEVMRRNITVLLFVANYYQVGLNELLIVLNSNDSATNYNSLESYFYSKVLAKQSIDYVEKQLGSGVKID